MFTQALLNATYKDGRIGTLTAAHEKAEHHRFKKDYLFKNTKIPKDLYALRLIQHLLIIKAIESRLQRLRPDEQSDISAFFSLSYLTHLWRTPGMEKDLEQLEIDSTAIPASAITHSTQEYLKRIEKLPPKMLLAHFLVHVAGFMHGGNIILSKYIAPSNRLTTYQIPTCQYDFSEALAHIDERRKTPIAVYQDMMRQVDQIPLSSEEYQDILNQCTGIYDTMAAIYDDLCAMQLKQKKVGKVAALVVISIVALSVIIELLSGSLSEGYSLASYLKPGI
ncbi:heme oxygenase (plasmid) [Legionella adelaidensis]|uniref:Heme oxygenase n=1 Tax=Legionella adelaidensis TaxID=45056 RepID=A0A0W0R0T4_9GAMM|nr:biliverdin-producing heme oxygenase [Legionella adelaidensis]KTC64708.1 heme oxygenase [Legionella adelaidensis]VEH86182.1 heme oxygenase [Legionella adelaidensis]